MQLLVLAAIIGAPVSAFAYGFLKVVDELQTAFFTSIPKDLGFDTVPAWWPLPVLAVAGLIVALAIRLFPAEAAIRPPTGSMRRASRRRSSSPASCSPPSGRCASASCSARRPR